MESKDKANQNNDNLMPIEPFLKKERVQTDDSLFAERGKTDDSLFDLRKKVERETDAKVEDDRNQVDHARRVSRSRVDENQLADMGLQYQRKLADKSTQAERSKIDEAIQSERAIKGQVLIEFLHRERDETDKNLSYERNQTDIAVSKSSNQLKEEVILHTKTRAELTTRDELVAIVSHDLRNPLGSIFSCAEMLLEEPSFAAMGSEFKYWIEMIKRNAENSLNLIGDILDMERVAEGKLEMHLRSQNLSQVIHETIDSFVPIATANQILLRFEQAQDNALIKFDRNRIIQVLSNLIGNALKFTPQGGTVSIRVEHFDHESIVYVRDTGIGVPDDQKEKIFARYAQIGKKDRKGLGLGLYISKTLIEAHGGRIWVTTPAGGGSVFHFCLPHSK